MRKFFVLTSMLLVTVGVFARSGGTGGTSAAELNQHCEALHAIGSAVYSNDRNADLGSCLGYMNAVLDEVTEDNRFEILKDFIVGDMIASFQRYAPQHYAEPARKAIVNAMIADGFLKRTSGGNNDSCVAR